MSSELLLYNIIGNVEFFNNQKGWGVIKTLYGQSLFVHHKSISDEKFYPKDEPSKFRTLSVGQRVVFDIMSNDKKMDEAMNVRFVNG